MVNGLLWTPQARKKKTGMRHLNAKQVLMALFAAEPQTALAVPTRSSRMRRVRCRLRAVFLSQAQRTPLANALLSTTLVRTIPYKTSTLGEYQQKSPKCSPLFSRFSAPTYMHTSGRLRPVRTSLRLLYLYLSNPTAAFTNFAKPCYTRVLCGGGVLVRRPFASI